MSIVVAVLQSLRTALRIVTETPVFVAFILAFGPVGTLNDASGSAGAAGSLPQLPAVSMLTGVFYTIIDGARPGSGTDLHVSTTAQRYYVSLFSAILLAGLVAFIVAMVVGGNVLGYVGFGRLDAVLNGSASLTLVEPTVSGAALVALAAVVYIFIFFDTVVALDGQTAGGLLSRNVDFVLSSLRTVIGCAVVATTVTSVVSLSVPWFVVLDRVITVADTMTAFQAPMSTVGIAVVAAGSAVTTLVDRTCKVRSYRACVDAAPGMDSESGDGERTA